MYELFEHQLEIDRKTNDAMRAGHHRILIQSPTGSGKTVMFAKKIHDANMKNKKCLLITDRIELLNGSNKTISSFNVKTTSILAGQQQPPAEYKHCVAMSQTLRKRINSSSKWIAFFNSFDVVIIDEAHVQEFNIYFVENAFNKKQYILAYTATPIRSRKQRGLDEDYTFLIEGPQIPYLISKGFLVRDKYYAPKHFDVSKIGLNSFGDFNESQMFKKYEETISYKSVVENWKRICEDTITIVFCVNIEHTIKTCKEFNDNGIKAKFIVSPLSNPKFKKSNNEADRIKYIEKSILYNSYKENMLLYSGEREEVINEWKNGKFKVLINTGIYTKGFDHKPIETVVVFRSTTSEALWLQMIGRGSRTYPGKTHFNILDFGSNAERLGMYNQERLFRLTKVSQESLGIAPVKECGIISGKKKPDKNGNNGCGALILASSQICRYCGYIFEKEKIEIDIDLVEVKYQYREDEYNGIDFAKLDRQAEERGYKHGWVINRVIADGGIDAIEKYAEYRKFNKLWVYRVQNVYKKQLAAYEEKQKLKN